jgi:hypothetical protein
MRKTLDDSAEEVKALKRAINDDDAVQVRSMLRSGKIRYDDKWASERAKWTALSHALIYKRRSVVQLLLEERADPNAVCFKGWDDGCLNGAESKYRHSQETGHDYINTCKLTPLACALISPRSETAGALVWALVKEGADLDLNFGWGPCGPTPTILRVFWAMSGCGPMRFPV